MTNPEETNDQETEQTAENNPATETTTSDSAEHVADAVNPEASAPVEQTAVEEPKAEETTEAEKVGEEVEKAVEGVEAEEEALKNELRAKLAELLPLVQKLKEKHPTLGYVELALLKGINYIV